MLVITHYRNSFKARDVMLFLSFILAVNVYSVLVIQAYNTSKRVRKVKFYHFANISFPFTMLEKNLTLEAPGDEAFKTVVYQVAMFTSQ